MTRGECSTAGQETKGGTTGFFQTTYCSNNNLPCACDARDRKGCSPGKEDVYWFDSCGNKEDVAEDCNYDQGTICRPDGNSASCQTVDCTSTVPIANNPHDPKITSGGARKNGESWCSYESGVGDYLDRPGSRHYRHLCVNGEELIQPCRDFREEICLQSNVSLPNGYFSVANCALNDIYDSSILENVSTTPKGQQFWTGDNQGLCNEADVECTVYWMREDRFSDWECVGNCQCEEQSFIDNAAYWCKTKGDCGAGINILNKRTHDGFEVQWTGTSLGAHPRLVSDSQFQEWSKYGIYGGIKFLSEQLATSYDPDDPLNGALNLVGVAAAATLIAYGVLALSGAVGAVANFAAATFGGAFTSAFGVSFTSSFAAGSAIPAGTVITSGSALPAGGGAALEAGSVVGEGGATAGTGTTGTAATSAISIIGVAVAVIIIIYGIVTGSIPTILMGIALGVGCLFGPLGCAVGAIIGFILQLILGKAKIKEKTVQITCNPWVAPPGGPDCEQCSVDPRYTQDNYKNPVTCSEYRCKSLGASCKLVNEGSTNAACVYSGINDVSPPDISPWYEILTPGFSIATTGSGYLIQPHVGYWQALTFGIRTSEVAQCRVDTQITNTYDEMQGFFGGSIYKTEHNITVSLPGGQSYTYYIRCRDVNGNPNTNAYTIQFSTTTEPDLTPPQIITTSIQNGAFVRYGVNQTDLIIYLNEPAEECRWNKGIDLTYDEMNETRIFYCGGSGSSIPGAPEPPTSPFFYQLEDCLGILTDIEDAVDNNYYIRCKDLAGNVNQQGHLFTLKGSRPLSITSTGPSGISTTGDVTLTVNTAEGAQNGNALCNYQPSIAPPLSTNPFIPFFNTGTATHTQPLQDLISGTYAYNILCADIAGNDANGTISFSVERAEDDVTPPRITLVYVAGTTLFLVTDEPSTCVYKTDSPGYLFEQGTNFGTTTLTHTLTVNAPTYYVKCKDQNNNLLDNVVIYL